MIDREFRDDLRRPHRASARGGRGLRPDARRHGRARRQEGAAARRGDRRVHRAHAPRRTRRRDRRRTRSISSRSSSPVATTSRSSAPRRYRNAYLTDLWQTADRHRHPDRSDLDRRPVARDRYRPGSRTRTRAGRVASEGMDMTPPRVLVVCLLLPSRSSACNKPTEEDCRKAIANMQKLLGTDNLSQTEDLAARSGAAAAARSKEAVECAIKATSLDELRACDFMKALRAKQCRDRSPATQSEGYASETRASRCLRLAIAGLLAAASAVPLAAHTSGARGARARRRRAQGDRASAPPARCTSPTVQGAWVRTQPIATADRSRTSGTRRRRGRRARRWRRVPARRQRLVGDAARPEGQGRDEPRAARGRRRGRQLYALDRTARRVSRRSSRSHPRPCSRSAPGKVDRGRDRARAVPRRRARSSTRSRGAPAQVDRLIGDRWAIVGDRASSICATRETHARGPPARRSRRRRSAPADELVAVGHGRAASSSCVTIAGGKARRAPRSR